MNIVRVLPRVVASKTLLTNKKFIQPKSVRYASGTFEWTYRKIPEITKEDHALLVRWSAFAWWWILWNLFTEYEELFSLNEPNPNNWTNKELGVPE